MDSVKVVACTSMMEGLPHMTTLEWKRPYKDRRHPISESDFESKDPEAPDPCAHLDFVPITHGDSLVNSSHAPCLSPYWF